MFYFIKTPKWLQLLYRDCIWTIPGTEKVIYLTFDDGPHPVITPFVLDELKKVNAKATFFCIGKNVVANPEVFKRIIREGHTIGNHTYNHLNGWKTNDRSYLDDVAQASEQIQTKLFRPPYGKITRFQLQQLLLPRFNLQTVMWSILSADFDVKISAKQCLENVLLNAFAGAIVVFHDSDKAYERLKTALPGTLKYLTEKGYKFERIIV